MAAVAVVLFAAALLLLLIKIENRIAERTDMPETFEDPRPWTDDELENMQEPPFVSQTEVERIISEIRPLPDDAKSWRTELPAAGMEDHIGQRLAALRFEVVACDTLQVDDLGAAAELLVGLRAERAQLDLVIDRWSKCVAGGVG